MSSNSLPTNFTVLFGAGLAAVSLVSCSSNNKTPLNDETVISGTLMAPDTSNGTDAEALLDKQFQDFLRISNDCPAVPDGYTPLANARISFVDENGEALGSSFTADDCGAFSTNAPDGAVGILAEAPGFRTLRADTDVFVGDGATGIASTIADTANYQIGALQIIDDSTLAFSVTDSESRNAVLGIPSSAFTVLLDSTSVTADSVLSASSTNNTENATVVLALDASGSMSASAYTDDNGVSYDRFQLTTIAAHQFLSQKADNDDIAISIFSSRIYFLDQDMLNRELPIVNSDGDPLIYALSEDGFTTDASRLRFLVDAYNRQSQLYIGSTDERHPDTPSTIELQSPIYPFSGGTDLYGAIQDSLNRLALRGSSRPVVVAMTDGADNGSYTDDDAIELAQQYGIPVHTIGMDSGYATDELQRVANETGGSFFSVTSTQIGDAFESIQTGIIFQYLATVPAGSLDTALTLGVKLDFNGLIAERSLTAINR